MKIDTRTGLEFFAMPARLVAYVTTLALGLSCAVSIGCSKASDPSGTRAGAGKPHIQSGSDDAGRRPSPASTEATGFPQVQQGKNPSPDASASDQLASTMALDSLAEEIKANGVGSDEMRDLSELFVKESRDEAWASSAEYTISNVATNLNRKYGAGLEVVKASCRQTLCELQVVNRKGVGGSPLDWNIAYKQLKSSLGSSNSQTIMRPLPDGQVVYHTYIIR